MKTIISLSIEALGSETSLSAIKRTRQAQIAATKSFPITAGLIRKLSIKIKLLKKQALKNYFKRQKTDAAKEAAHKSEKSAHKPTAAKKPTNKSHSSVFISESMSDEIVSICDRDLLACCTFASDSAVSVQTKGEKKKEGQSLKKTLKSNPKSALHKKQMSAAMRIRENKKIRLEIKKLLETKKKLQDKAWGLYVAKLKGKKSEVRHAPKSEPKGDLQPLAKDNKKSRGKKSDKAVEKAGFKPLGNPAKK